MTQYTSPHDEPWFSDPDQPWGGSHKRIERDPDEERERRMDDTLPPLYWATIDGRAQQVTAEQYAAIYGANAK